MRHSNLHPGQSPTNGGTVTGALYETPEGDHVQALPTMQQDWDAGRVSLLVVSTSGGDREGRCKLAPRDAVNGYRLIAMPDTPR